MSEPDFIIGASKCGTSSLYYNMLKHPDIVHNKQRKKELRFFYRPKRYKKGPEWYLSRFNVENNKLCGEGSVGYFDGGDKIINRIKNELSQYCHALV